MTINTQPLQWLKDSHEQRPQSSGRRPQRRNQHPGLGSGGCRWWGPQPVVGYSSGRSRFYRRFRSVLVGTDRNDETRLLWHFPLQEMAARWPAVAILVCLLLGWNWFGTGGRSLWYSHVGGQMKEAQTATQQGGEEPRQSPVRSWRCPNGRWRYPIIPNH